MSKIKIPRKDIEREDLNKFIPQEDYLKSLYTVTQRWHSDIKFFEGELDFFRLLIDKHLLLLIDPKHIENTRLMVSRCIDLESDRVSLEGRITLHNLRLTDLVKYPFVQKEPDYREEHAKLEVEFSSFVSKFRYVKSEVFKLTKWVIHSEKVKRVIDSA